MSNRLEPAHYNNLDAIIPAAWSPLKHGVSDRKSGSHILQVATLNTDGLPTTRSVVLLAFEEQTRTLRFHTDFRSEKAKEIFDRPQIAVRIYDRVEKAQIHLRCRATLHHRDSQSADAWRSMPGMSRKCYGQIDFPATRSIRRHMSTMLQCASSMTPTTTLLSSLASFSTLNGCICRHQVIAALWFAGATARVSRHGSRHKTKDARPRSQRAADQRTNLVTVGKVVK